LFECALNNISLERLELPDIESERVGGLMEAVQNQIMFNIDF